MIQDGGEEEREDVLLLTYTLVFRDLRISSQFQGSYSQESVCEQDPRASQEVTHPEGREVNVRPNWMEQDQFLRLALSSALRIHV